MFRINDYIVYGGNGVCKIVDIGESEIGINNKQYYTLEPVYTNGRILTPIDNDKIVMREVISKEDAENLIDSIPSMEVDWIADNKEREQKYKEIVKKFDCSGFLKAIKIINLRKKKCTELGKKISIMDDRYFKRIKDFLDGEFAIALDIPKDNVNNYIKNTLKSQKAGA